MRDLKTKTKAFDSGYFIPRLPNQLYIRVKNAAYQEVSDTFNNPAEIAEISYRGRIYHDYTKCRTIRDEGTQIFLILERE